MTTSFNSLIKLLALLGLIAADLVSLLNLLFIIELKAVILELISTITFKKSNQKVNPAVITLEVVTLELALVATVLEVGNSNLKLFIEALEIKFLISSLIIVYLESILLGIVILLFFLYYYIRFLKSLANFSLQLQTSVRKILLFFKKLYTLAKDLLETSFLIILLAG